MPTVVNQAIADDPQAVCFTYQRGYFLAKIGAMRMIGLDITGDKMLYGLKPQVRRKL
jgi:hypothetical protein